MHNSDFFEDDAKSIRAGGLPRAGMRAGEKNGAFPQEGNAPSEKCGAESDARPPVSAFFEEEAFRRRSVPHVVLAFSPGNVF